MEGLGPRGIPQGESTGGVTEGVDATQSQDLGCSLLGAVGSTQGPAFPAHLVAGPTC